VTGEAQPVATVDGIVVVAGQQTTEDRLTVDLRGRLQAIQIEVRDSAGAPVNAGGATAVVLPPGKATEVGAFVIKLGRATILSSGSSVDLAIVVPGHRVENVYGVTSGARIALRPGPCVRIRFHCEGPLPAGFRWEAELWGHREEPDTAVDTPWYRGSLHRMIHHGPRAVAVGGEARMNLQMASKYRVAVFLGNIGVHSSKPVADPEPQFIDVADSETEQVFDVRIPVASLEKAYRRKER